MNGHLPPTFNSWDWEQQVDYVGYTHTRRGLVASVLSQAGVEIADRDITRDYQLTKDDLAAIYLAMEGYDQ